MLAPPLEPARVGILLMAEVVLGPASAVTLASALSELRNRPAIFTELRDATDVNT
jgi:hypothetical protein